MIQPRKRTTQEVWRALEKNADEVELARIDAMSDEELDRELRAAGDRARGRGEGRKRSARNR